ncbi:hypothetical protein CFC21_056074 [Triticum aestivum]|uniref:Uncharacterized protein n=2 Tax=Triticum aestivum TaxID=4565 RepID=A0A3B6IJ40_WHEAT|nr:disease resistance protein RPS2-like [Triticum aestivum]KAF7047109.1 hypothetical protein CFC21_056074 [Triticum aestivum]
MLSGTLNVTIKRDSLVRNELETRVGLQKLHDCIASACVNFLPSSSGKSSGWSTLLKRIYLVLEKSRRVVLKSWSAPTSSDQLPPAIRGGQSHMAHGFQYGVLSPVVGLFVNEIWEPIKKHFGYCLKPGSKVRKLARAADGLKSHIDTIDEQIQLGKRPRDSTKSWIGSAKSIENESVRIKNEYEERRIYMFGCSWNCLFNYRIGRAAIKKKKEVDELMERPPQNDGIFSLLPPVGKELPLPPNIVGQNKYMEEIVACIEQGTTTFIGICGMGGAGKTTLLKQLNNVFSCTAEMHKFDHVIYVEIDQQPNPATVQQSIASQLGLTLGQDESTTARSASLYNFLKERKFLLLVDNLWQPLDLVKVGIPQGYIQIGPQNRNMVVVTARDRQMCHRMQAHNLVITLQSLRSDEAWSLFEANAGCNRLTNSSLQIRGYAEGIVDKCGGLPLALKVVGQAMAMKESEHEWKHAVMLLRQSQFHKVPDAESNLFPILYISYDHLPDVRTKKCFLFFALNGTKYYNYSNYLIDLWMGHGLLDEEDDDTKNCYLRGHSVVGCLKRACLLEEHPRGEIYLRMHDMIRGLALWIVAEQQGDGCNNKWLLHHSEEPDEWSKSHRISLSRVSDVKILDYCSCPDLLTLVLDYCWTISKVPVGFFTDAPSLTYLNLSYTNIQELPSDVGALVNLRHLDLSYTCIQSIPIESKLLKSLRYLYLGFTAELTYIPDGIISALGMLRVLDLYYSACLPEHKTHALIKELESLTRLQFLGFTVADTTSLHRLLDLSKASLKSLHIKSVNGLQNLNLCPRIVSKMRAHQLEILAVSGIESLEELLVGGENDVDSDWLFQSLDQLQLVDLKKLVGIVRKGVRPRACLPKLRFLLLDGCHSIRSITWVKHLPCLEEVCVIDCDLISELVTDDDEEVAMSSAMASFPRLKLLGLSHLTNLKNICDSTLGVASLQRFLVYNCPMLTKLPSGLLKEDHAPLILGQQYWWDQLVWDDGSTKSTLFPFFRELPADFQGRDSVDVFSALVG